jgi:aminomethyltransferase
MAALSRSPLDAEHHALGAHMGAFAGWEMPISYQGTLAEHSSVRSDVGVFDVSHLGKLIVEGPGARELLDRTLSNRMADLAPGRARYTLMLTKDAGIVDDMIVYALAAERLLVVPNAANVAEVESRLREAAGAGVSIARGDHAIIAVQGPRSPQVLRAALPDAPDLGYMRCAMVGSVTLSRSGYTGERGYEIFAPPPGASTIWRSALAAGAVPCGLAARDTLRLEMGYPLHGNDIDQDTTPGEAHLDWAVAPSKEAFTGKEAHESRPPRKELVGLVMEDRLIPRRGSHVRKDGRAVGSCTSGTFSPTLRVGIAMAYVEPGLLREDDSIEVEVRGKRGNGRVAKPPFVGSSPK